MTAPTPQRVLFLCGGSYVSGMEVVELARMVGLQAQGVAVHCITSGWTDGDFPARLDRASIPYTTAFVGKVSLTPRRIGWTLDALWHLPGARRVVRRALQEFRPDIVVACSRDSVLLLSSLLREVPVLYHLHETPATAGRGQQVVRAIDRRVDGFLAVSHYVAERLVAAGVAADRISVVHNGVAPAGTREPESDNVVPTVVIAGQVDPWKGHDVLLDALAALDARGVSFRCVVAGRGSEGYASQLVERAAVLGITNHIHFAGFMDNVDDIYRDANIVAVPSLNEDPFPTTILEAGARGLPVVASRTGGIPEQIVDGETGLLFESGNAGRARVVSRAAPELRRDAPPDGCGRS